MLQVKIFEGTTYQNELEKSVNQWFLQQKSTITVTDIKMVAHGPGANCMISIFYKSPISNDEPHR